MRKNVWILRVFSVCRPLPAQAQTPAPGVAEVRAQTPAPGVAEVRETIRRKQHLTSELPVLRAFFHAGGECSDWLGQSFHHRFFWGGPRGRGGRGRSAPRRDGTTALWKKIGG